MASGIASSFVGYARSSADAHDLTAQHDALTALGVKPNRIYVDHFATCGCRIVASSC